jgi:hypothetical protein
MTSSPPPALLIPSNIKGNTAHCFAYPFASPSLPSRHVPAMTASPAARIITQLIEHRSLIIIIIIQAGVRVTDRHDAFVPWLGRNFQSCPGRIGVVWSLFRPAGGAGAAGASACLSCFLPEDGAARERGRSRTFSAAMVMSLADHAALFRPPDQSTTNRLLSSLSFSASASS